MKSLWPFLAALLISACGDDYSGTTNAAQSIDVRLQSKIEDTVRRDPTTFSEECRNELGLCWYKLTTSKNKEARPSVKLEASNTSLILEEVTSITIVLDKKVGDSIENIDITLRGLPDNSPHEEQINFIYDLLEKIQTAGWKHYYFPSDPRISGSQLEKTHSPDTVLGHFSSSHPWLDPNYKLDLKRWLKIESFYNWYFYNDDAYLTFKAWRRDSKDTPDKTGTYLLSMEILSERDFWSSGFTKEEEKMKWKELLPAQLKRDHDARLAAEEDARAAGIEIDETYKDPVIKSIQ